MTILLDEPSPGLRTYVGDTFQIVLQRYSDPQRLNAARNAAIYLGKSDRANVNRPLSIIRSGHVPEIFRGEHAEFEFIDVSKEVYDHIVTYTTRNMRIAGGNRALASHAFTMPSDVVRNPDEVHEAIARSMDNYNALLAAGETRQVARAAMPVNAKMNNFAYQFNFVTLMQSLFTQRIWDVGAQGNTIKVVRGMWELVHSVDPELWLVAYEYFGPPKLEWIEVGEKMKKRSLDQVIETLVKFRDEYEGAATAKANVALRMAFGTKKSMW